MKIARSAQLADKDVDDLMRLYQGTDWADDRTREQTVCLLNGSQYLFAFRDVEADRLVGFARAFTDGVFLAMVCDVIVAEDYRERGIGRMIMEAVIAHPELAKVKHLQLNCMSDMVSFYRKWGFRDDLGELRCMRRSRA